MNLQCDVARLDGALDREATEAERAWATEHLRSCEKCRAAVERRLALDARLVAMPIEMQPHRALWPGIADRVDLHAHVLHSRSIGSGTVWRIAAAVVLFAGGYMAGTSREQSHHRNATEGPLLATSASVDPAQAAADVQRIGSAWTASLARVAWLNASSPALVRQGREVALSTMRGAAAELVRIAPDRPGVVAAYTAIVDEQRTLTAAPASRRVAF
jgi:predicted anti-sigma-YlaC factor YlaD